MNYSYIVVMVGRFQDSYLMASECAFAGEVNARQGETG
jgi:hypothetical protein